MQSPDPAAEAAQLREALAAVLEALDIPNAATVGEQEIGTRSLSSVPATPASCWPASSAQTRTP